MKLFKDYLTEDTIKPLHAELKELGNTYHENGGSSSVSTTRFRDKNQHLDKIHKMALARGYKLVSPSSNHNGKVSNYRKELDGGKRIAHLDINHYPGEKHVYSVDTITYRDHY
jgi:hypothetical protein